MNGNTGVTTLEYGSSAPPRVRSWPGIFSFVLALLAVGLIVGGGVMVYQLVSGLPRSGGAPVALIMALGGLIITVWGGVLVLSIIGVGLAIWSLLQPNRKRLFGILGLVINGTLLLGAVGFVIMGLAK